MWIIGQTILNIAAVTGMIPDIGVPLPSISYGGASVIAVLAAVGVLIACSRAPGRASYPSGGEPLRREGRR